MYTPWYQTSQLAYCRKCPSESISPKNRGTLMNQQLVTTDHDLPCFSRNGLHLPPKQPYDFYICPTKTYYGMYGFQWHSQGSSKQFVLHHARNTFLRAAGSVWASPTNSVTIPCLLNFCTCSTIIADRRLIHTAGIPTLKD